MKRSTIAPWLVALLCGAFVLAGPVHDASAKSRKSRAVRKAEEERKKAEEERKKAEEERKKAEEQRLAAEKAAAEAKRQADEAKKQLQKMKSGATVPAKKPAPGDSKPLWSGFFLSFNVGYATAGGEKGPTIPDPSNTYKTNLTPGIMRAANFSKYSEAVTTDVGAGLAVALQIGYNIAGYVSLWADIAAHGSFGAKSDTAGGGAVSVMLGLHPLRFWRPDAPADLKVYGGYGIFEMLGYHEIVFQLEPTGKAWTGTSIPFGLSAEYRIPASVFALGLDLRFVAASYDRWIYNYDEDMKSDLGTAQYPNATTFRFEPRVIFGWHF